MGGVGWRDGGRGEGDHLQLWGWEEKWKKCWPPYFVILVDDRPQTTALDTN